MARQSEGEILSFKMEWFDHHAQLNRYYLLKYFCADECIEMIDLKNRRLFLKKSKCPASITKSSLYVGAKIMLHGRQLVVLDYSDTSTKSKLDSSRQKCCLIIKPDAFQHTGKILDSLSRNGFTLSNIQAVKLSPAQASFLCKSSEGTAFFEKCVEHLTSGNSVIVELVAQNAVAKLQSSIGPLRARYASGDVTDAVEAATDIDDADMKLKYFFGASGNMAPTATYDSCTCCVIKPHAIKAGNAGQIIDAILEQGYEISALKLFNLQSVEAAEFLEVYKNVSREFNDMVGEFCTGPCIALELRAEDAVTNFRQTCGPFDVEMAQAIRPNTLRAKFGVDRLQNAVHCTDLEEDAVLECEFFFSICAMK